MPTIIFNPAMERSSWTLLTTKDLNAISIELWRKIVAMTEVSAHQLEVRNQLTAETLDRTLHKHIPWANPS